jgi:YesN/AraC family two-component response regulator
LVADDHADLRAHVRSLLLHRFEVLEAHDGPSAWACAQEQLPDLIVSDVMMPGFDGIELTRRLRADPDTAAIGLLLLTARAGSEHAVAALRAGANDYLVKPFDAAELLARIDAIHAHAQRLRLRLAREAESAAGSELLSPARIAANVPPEPSAEQSWRLRLEQLIVQHLDDSTLTVQRLAERLHMDRSSLFRRCKEVLGSSPSDYLRELRLQRAQQLLEQAVGNVSEVAYAVGFESLSSFTRAFKQRYGLAPSRVVQATWAVQTQRAS